MKAIIHGLRYNTDAAILIGKSDASPGAFKGDFAYWEAGLYRTPGSGRRGEGGYTLARGPGRYFLAGRGGPMTRFAMHVQNGSQGGSRIIPLEPDEAREWAEQYLTAAEVEAAFADQIEDA